MAHQTEQELMALPRQPRSSSSERDRRARRRVLAEMKQDRPVDEKQEAEYLEDLAQRMRLF